MDRKVIATERAPRAIGPYSQAIVARGLVFCSGQIPLDPQTGEMIGAGDVRVQTHRVMENLKAVLEEAGSSMSSVLKVTIYLADLADYGAVNEIYSTYFRAEPPARAAVQVAALPKGSLVEIDAIGMVGA